MKETQVVAALIRRGDKFLICRRPPDKKRGLLWEFVGGKVEAGETAEAALVRECEEEMGIKVRVEKPFCTVVHEYPDLTVRLTLFTCSIEEGEPKMLEHVDMRWIRPDEADAFEFCPADLPIIRKLKFSALAGNNV